tara:strand:+ start:429 stop:872 length:444 start_codon:yes stop_codon:yes gene_type:complete
VKNVIREIEDKDVPLLFPVRIVTRENRMSMEELASIGITVESIREAIKGSHKGWLSEECGRVVGFAMGDFDDAEMTVIALLPEYEGKGIGSQLLTNVENWLHSKGCNEIWLTTDIDQNFRAYSFYKKHGWQDSEIKNGCRYMAKAFT